MRRLGKALVAIPLTMIAVYLLLRVVAWLMVSPVEPAAFFDPRPEDHDPLVFAHQGGEALAPSNTMVAFHQAVDLGADVLDADTHLTADGVLVLIHDTTVDRTSNGSGAVVDLTLDELRALDFGYTFTTDDGATFPFRSREVGIVTVEELFSEFDGHRFNIEIKQTPVEAADVFCELIRRFDYEDRIVVSSFGQANMDAFRRACPSVATAATEDEVRRFYLMHRIGLDGLLRPAYQSLQVPEYSGDLLILSEGFMDDAAKHGLAVVPWTINEVADLERIMMLDPAGINTDHPDRLVELIEG